MEWRFLHTSLIEAGLIMAGLFVVLWVALLLALLIEQHFSD